MFHGLAIEVILFVLILTLLLLMGFRKDNLLGRLFEPVCYIGYLLAVLMGSKYWNQPSESLFYSALKTDILFRPIRIAMTVVGLLFVRMLLASREISTSRKREIILLFTLNVLMVNILVLSDHFLISILTLSAIGLISSLLIGIPFHGRLEVEGAQKSWGYVVAAICFGMGSSCILALGAGGLSYSALHAMFMSNLGFSGFLMASLCLIPFFWVGGVFPFHFFGIDRAQASRWPIQAHLSVHTMGGAFLALLRLVVTLFNGVLTPDGPFCLVMISIFGLCGALWGCWGAFSQKSIKRRFAYLVFAAWSVVLFPIGLPSALGLAAALFWATMIIFALGVLGWGLGDLSERANSDDLGVISRVPHSKFVTGLLLFSLSCLQVFPPLPGFVGFLNLLAACMERTSVLLVALMCMVFLLLLLSSLKIYVGLTRQFLMPSGVPLENNALGGIDYLILGAICTLLLAMGIYWDPYMSVLVLGAKSFIIS